MESDVHETSSESIACNLGAFTPEQRRAHEAEGAALVEEATATIELLDGFELRLPAAAATAAVHWFAEERLCCPFLSFEMRWGAKEDSVVIRLRGADGTKDILRPVLART